MNILDSIFEKWDADKDIEYLISSGLFSDKNAIQTILDSLSGTEKENAISKLSEIQTALHTYISNMEQSISEVKKQMDTTSKSEKACLSYGSSVDIQNNKKEDK